MTRLKGIRPLSGLLLPFLLVAPAAGAVGPVTADAPAAPAATAPAAASPKAKPPPAPPPPSEAQLDLDKARALFARKRFDQALKVLDAASQEDGADALKDQLAAARVEALLSKRRPDEKQAREIVLEVLHRDPDGKVFNQSPDAVNALVNDIRDTHPLVIHVPIPASRAGHPLRLRARVQDPKDAITSVTLHLRGHDIGDYSDAVMERSGGGWSVLIRDTGALAPDGITDDYAIDYYLTAADASGGIVDQDGSAEAPLSVTISTAKAEAAESAAGVDLNAIARAENAPPPVVVVAPPVTPWYLRWYSLAAGGAVLAAIIVVPTVLAATRPHAKLPEHIGTLTFSVSP